MKDVAPDSGFDNEKIFVADGIGCKLGANRGRPSDDGNIAATRKRMASGD
jgi:hypothetical protein